MKIHLDRHTTWYTAARLDGVIEIHDHPDRANQIAQVDGRGRATMMAASKDMYHALNDLVEAVRAENPAWEESGVMRAALLALARADS